MGSGDKRRFRNTTAGYLGVSVLNTRGEATSYSLEPNEEIALSDEERRLTANAPRDPAYNPFIATTDGVPWLQEVDPDERPIENRRPTEFSEEHATAPHAQGSRLEAEEVGTRVEGE